MNVCIRTDSSVAIGSGHVMRCLTLADALHDANATVSFICRELPGNLNEYIAQKGYQVHSLPFKESMACEEDAQLTLAILEGNGGSIDWLIVDHYGIDARWESILRSRVKKIMVIDDLADRRHECDLILDQNYYPEMEHRYDDLLPTHCRKLLGPGHALLRMEFLQARKKLRQRDGSVGRILISFGGSDLTNETEKAVLALRMLNRPNILLDVVVGSANPHRAGIEKLCSALPNATFHYQISNIAELMIQADLAIGAGGASTWERCFLGLPTLTVITADNQTETTVALAAAGVIWNLGCASEVTAESLLETLWQVLTEPIMLREKSLAALRIMGVADAGEETSHYCTAADLANLLLH